VIKVVFCLRRRADVDEAAFHRYWREQHAPLVTSLAPVLGIRRYVQVHATPGRASDALAIGRGAPERYDGVAELWLDSLDALIAAVGTPEGAAADAALRADEAVFIDHARSPIFLAEDVDII
jgi:uncharacterized protein (TIGR02118 family)